MSSNMIFIPPSGIALPNPANIGEFFEGGYYTGNIKVGNNVYALILAPRGAGSNNEGTNNFKKNTTTDGRKALSLNDGWANTIALNDADHYPAQWARGLVVNGFNDWYLPARDELELVWRNLKPSSSPNNTTARAVNTGDNVELNGYNGHSYPQGAGYTASNPAVTPVIIFQKDREQAMMWTSKSPAFYWSSTVVDPGSNVSAWGQNFDTGQQFRFSFTTLLAMRAVRRVLIGPAP